MGPYDSAHQVAELTRQVRAIGADLDAERRSRYDSDRDAARLREKLERVTADLARVEAERDEARALIEQWTLDLARLGEERDEARAKVAGLTLSPLAVKCIRRALDDAANDYANSHSDIDAEIIVEMDRYAETLGGA